MRSGRGCVSHTVPLGGPDRHAWAQNVVPWEAHIGAPEIFIQSIARPILAL